MSDPTDKPGPTFEGVVTGAGIGLLLMPALMMLFVITCTQVTDGGDDHSGPAWLLPAAIRIAAVVGLFVGPFVGAIVGALYLRRRPTDKAAQ